MPMLRLRLTGHRWTLVGDDGQLNATYRTAAEAMEARRRTGHRRGVRDGRWWMIPTDRRTARLRRNGISDLFRDGRGSAVLRFQHAALTWY
jgi:hypothetical protein